MLLEFSSHQASLYDMRGLIRVIAISVVEKPKKTFFPLEILSRSLCQRAVLCHIQSSMTVR